MDEDSIHGPSGRGHGSSGVMRLITGIAGVGVLLSPITFAFDDDGPEVDRQDPGTCATFVRNNPNIDPAIVNCEDKS